MTRGAKLAWLLLGACALSALICLRVEPLVIHNRSPSAPIGFYVRSRAAASAGDFVTLRPPASVRAYAAQRGFGDESDRFLKRIVATPGQRVCAVGDTILIDGEPRAGRAARDSAGRPLPRWTGCVGLGAGEVFLLGAGEDSFDGRYWGVTRRDEIDGVWRPL
jgi:conjugative transfer signal peptidase TraF